MIYCNPVPVAAACLLGSDVVKDALNTLITAIIDLVKYGKDINLPFGFCNIRITAKNLKVTFSDEFTNSM